MTDDPVWQVLIQPPAARALTRIAPRYREALVAFVVGGLAENPERRGRRLRGELAGLWSALRGDFRVIYRVDHETRTLHIRQVAGRADAYRPD